MVSSIGADDPGSASRQMRPYLEAKSEADRALAASGLDFTIVRPGRLTDDPGTGLVAAGPGLERDEIARADVAAVIAEALTIEHTIGQTFVLVQGRTPVAEALHAL